VIKKELACGQLYKRLDKNEMARASPQTTGEARDAKRKRERSSQTENHR